MYRGGRLLNDYNKIVHFCIYVYIETGGQIGIKLKTLCEVKTLLVIFPYVDNISIKTYST